MRANRKIVEVCPLWLDEAKAIAVGVFDVHFAGTPSLVDGWGIDRDALGNELGVQGIDGFNDEIGNATGDPITGKRGEVQPHTVAGNPHVAGIAFHAVGPVGKRALKTKLVAIEPRRRPSKRGGEESQS